MTKVRGAAAHASKKIDAHKPETGDWGPRSIVFIYYSSTGSKCSFMVEEKSEVGN